MNHKITAITVAHCRSEILAHGLVRLYTTAGYSFNHVLVNNHWPLGHDVTQRIFYNLSEGFGCTDCDPGKNIGGHGGFSFGLKYTDADYIVCFDPDSNPVSYCWMGAMLDVMITDPKMAYVSLLHNDIVNNRDWTFETIAGHKVALHPEPDMFNVTMFRKEALTKGLIADCAYWGRVEVAMDRHIKELGMRRGYLYDWREEKCPIPHPPIYNEWKGHHAMYRYPGNFCDYVKEKGLQ